MARIIVIDDIRATLGASLQEHLGSSESDLHALLRQFHNFLAKHIRARPRRTHLSEEILRHALFLREKKQVIERIMADIDTGSDLSKYHSEKSTQLEHHDKSLAHFGVHHFHLGDAVEARGARKGRVKGTKSLLFLRVLDDDAYLLDILDHGMHTGFLNIRLFRLMHRNWPHSVESHRIKNAIGLARTYTDMEAAKLLENDVNTCIEPEPGQVFMLPGMGTTTAGTSMLVERDTDRVMDAILEIAASVKRNPTPIAMKITAITGIRHNTIRLRGRVKDGLLDIYDGSSGLSLRP